VQLIQTVHVLTTIRNYFVFEGHPKHTTNYNYNIIIIINIIDVDHWFFVHGRRLILRSLSSFKPAHLTSIHIGALLNFLCCDNKMPYSL
jgi:hypothetical protein